MPILARSQRQDSKPGSWTPESLLLTIMSHLVRTEVPAVVEAALGRQDSEEEEGRGKKSIRRVLSSRKSSWMLRGVGNPSSDLLIAPCMPPHLS